MERGAPFIGIGPGDEFGTTSARTILIQPNPAFGTPKFAVRWCVSPHPLWRSKLAGSAAKASLSRDKRYKMWVKRGLQMRSEDKRSSRGKRRF